MNTHLITPCPVCHMIAECPHTPVRCQHGWKYERADAQGDIRTGDRRTCEWCERTEQAVIRWDTVRVHD